MVKEIKSVNEIETICTYCAEERETTINMCALDDFATIYVSDNTFLTKMKKLFSENPQAFKCYEMGRNSTGGVTGYKFTCPKELINVRKKRNEANDEVKTQRSERFKQLHREGKIGRSKKQ